jgi:hypothetical protein
VGYPNRARYLALYKGERCHLLKWHRGMELKTPKKNFNHIHARVSGIIERSFRVWNMRWQIHYKMSIYPMWKQRRIVVGTIVVHNFIREHKSGDLTLIV